MHDRVRVYARFGTALVAAVLSLWPSPALAEFPTLERAIALARTRALIVVDAEGELGAADAQMVGARVSAIGNPYTDAQIDRGFSSGVHEVQALTYTYFPVDLFGQRGKRVDEASRLIDWRKLGVVDARSIATGEVTAAYGQMVVSSARVREAETGEQTAREEAKYFEGRFEAKDTTLFEKSLAEAEVARWVQARAEAELRLTQSRALFGQLTGELAVAVPPPSATVVPPALRARWDDAYVARIVDRVPVVARLAAERGYWEASIDRYERERIPPVSFEVIAGRGSQGEARLGGGAVITFPITRRYQGEIARAEQGKASAMKRLDAHRTIVQTRLRAARDSIAAVAKAIEELDKAGIPALERAVTASVEAFRAGKIDLTRALLARRDLALSRARRLDLLEASWGAYADLAIVSGELP